MGSIMVNKKYIKIIYIYEKIENSCHLLSNYQHAWKMLALDHESQDNSAKSCEGSEVRRA